MSASPSPAASSWSEYKNSEGRPYWSHNVTKQSVWEKPDELKTPFEKAMAKTDWKQYVSKGRPYYVHKVTKDTKWDMPPELEELKSKVEAEEAYRAERKRRIEQGLSSPTPPRGMSPGLEANDRNALERYRSLSPDARSDTPEELEVITYPVGGFPTFEKAEAGFIYLLKRERIDDAWTWDQTMRKIIMDPLYKSLTTLSEKRAAFEKYTSGLVAEKRAAKDARIAKARPALSKLFAQSGYIKPYSTIKTADMVFARDRLWRDTRPDERRMILEEYVSDLRRKEEEAEKEQRERNISALTDLVRDLEITVATSWRAAHNLILAAPAFKENHELAQIESVDMLSVFDDYMRQLEQEEEEEVKRYRQDQVRRVRKARDGFKALLSELEAKGELKRNSKWKETLPKIKSDERFKAMLGLPGSSAMDLWMDAVDDLDEEIDRAAAKLEKGIVGEIKVDTTFEQFEKLVKEAGLDSQVDSKLRKAAYELIHERLVQQAADEARRAERKRRHRMDDLRYALKKVTGIRVDTSYDEAVPLMKDLPEFSDVVDEEDRKAAYDKHIRRLKEKLAETEAVSTSRRDSHRMDLDDDRRDRRRTRSRERSRDRRPERPDRKERRYSPERDERDRKRARRSSDVGKHDDVEEGEI